jgi:hypothetical protein
MPIRCNADVKASYEHPRGVCENDAAIMVAMPQRGEHGDLMAYCEEHIGHVEGLREVTPAGGVANIQAVITLICQDLVRRLTESN